MSNTSQATKKALSRREVERPEGMVDIASVHARMRGGNGVRLPPQSFTVEKPGPLTLCQVGKRGSLIQHNMRMMPQPAAAAPCGVVRQVIDCGAFTAAHVVSGSYETTCTICRGHGIPEIGT